MSNIGKHLVALSGGGYVYYRGVILSETDKSYMVSPKYGRPRRMLKGKSDILLPSGADPDVCEAAYLKAFKEGEAECRRLEEEARNARHQQREVAIAAMRKVAGEES